MDDEMFGYTQKIRNDFEQQKDTKLESMRERVVALREKREQEDRKIVDEKLEQSFQLVITNLFFEDMKNNKHKIFCKNYFNEYKCHKDAALKCMEQTPFYR